MRLKISIYPKLDSENGVMFWDISKYNKKMKSWDIIMMGQSKDEDTAYEEAKEFYNKLSGNKYLDITKFIIEKLDIPKLTLNTEIENIIDSVDFLDLLVEIETNYKITINQCDMYDFKTFGKLIDYIVNIIEGKYIK